MIDEEEYLNYILLNERVWKFRVRVLSLTLKGCKKDNKGMPILKSLRICEREIGDEWIRTIHQFIIETNNSLLNLIELLNDNIDLLGCEFISRIYEPSFPCNFKILTLDYNRFGNEGLNNLLNYLPTNTTLTYLSLNYCDINEKGIPFFEKYIKYITATKTLKKLI
jgi:hypothetical protein